MQVRLRVYAVLAVCLAVLTAASCGVRFWGRVGCC